MYHNSGNFRLIILDTSIYRGFKFCCIEAAQNFGDTVTKGLISHKITRENVTKVIPSVHGYHVHYHIWEESVGDERTVLRVREQFTQLFATSQSGACVKMC